VNVDETSTVVLFDMLYGIDNLAYELVRQSRDQPFRISERSL